MKREGLEKYLKDALDLIRERGQVRSAAIGELLVLDVDQVHVLLQPAVDAGELVCCDVLVGGLQQKEYRESMAAGTPAAKLSTDTGYLFPKNRQAATEPNAAQPPQGEPQMATKTNKKQTRHDKIAAAFKAHGPMTTRELREHVQITGLNAVVRTEFEEVGTLGARKRVYGLEGQTMKDRKGADAGESAPTSSRATRKPAGRTKRAPRGSSIPAIATDRVMLASTFRPALAHDGSILLIGQEKAGELNRNEARMLSSFIVRLHESGARE